jgi:hypothetical protein
MDSTPTNTTSRDLFTSEVATGFVILSAAKGTRFFRDFSSVPRTFTD